MDEDKESILVKSVEEETGITYAYIFSIEDVQKILRNVGLRYFELENGCYAGYKENKIMIRCQTGSLAFFSIKDVHRQIKDQL